MKSPDDFARRRIRLAVILLVLALSIAAGERGAKAGAKEPALTKQDCRPSARERDLFEAILQKDVTKVKQLLAEGVNPNASSVRPFKTTNGPPVVCAPALMHALVGGDPDIVEALLAGKADVNRTDSAGHLVWSYAFRTYMVPDEAGRLCKALIDAGADLHARNAQGETLLELAVTEGEVGDFRTQTRLRWIESLLAAGLPVNGVDKQGRTALAWAIRASVADINVIRTLIMAGANVNTADIEGRTPLMEAINRSPEMVRLLIESRASVNAWDRDGNTALNLALMEGRGTEYVKPLLAGGSNLNLKNHDGDSPLILAARGFGLHWQWDHEGEHILAALVAGGADVTAENRDGESALTIVAAKAGPEGLPVIRLLTATAGAHRHHGYPRVADLLAAIRRAAGHSRAEVVQELIHAGIDVNGADEYGTPVLTFAVAESGNPNVVSLLLSAGARVNATDRNGDTALIAAVREYGHSNAYGDGEIVKKALHRNLGLVRVILEAKADVGVRDKAGLTALDLAKESGDQALTGLLEDALARSRATR
ncbi:MAG TPA: ankyrin repeat domain-containing protein [Blastocatellia bacterium]|nr:ankyrin repeat domain-containing protein [Blastocatellia bacterium]